ncbi:ribonuclease H-like domain-containing protein [Bacillus sp. JJ634]
MSLKSKLNRLKPHMNREVEQNPLQKKSEEKAIHQVDIPYEDKWRQNDTSCYYFDGSYCFIREVRYPLDYQHGRYSFSQLQTIMKQWNAVSFDHPLSGEGLDSGDLFFFDTETTGLSGGAGNTIFLLGYAYVTETEVIVRQHILPQPGHEIPLYQSFLERINYETLVTYNGKSFDWPQLTTQHTLIKEHVPKLPEFGHFDLYHASRRLWKDQLERVKLSVVETDILGVERVNDIPGYLAPMIYFDFVERKDPEILFGILKHNELDILSLISLYIHISRQILQMDGHTDESIKVARWLDYIGEQEGAVSTYEAVRKSGSNVDRLTASHALAFQKKRHKQFQEALDLWQEIVNHGNSQQRIEASIECAKLHEHQFKDVASALEYTEKALQEIENIITKKSVSKWQEDLERRISRLKRKRNHDG